VAFNGSITYANVAIETGLSFFDGDAVVRAAYGTVVLGSYVRNVHRYPNNHLGVVLDNEEKKAHRLDGKPRKNAYAHAHTPSV